MQRLGKHRPRVFSARIIRFHDGAKPLLARIDGGQRHLIRFRVHRFRERASGEFQRLFFLFRRRVGVQAVKPALAFAARVTRLDHLMDKGMVDMQRAVGILWRQRGQKRRRQFGDQIDADQIQQAEHARFGNAHGFRHHGIRELQRTRFV
jgi:hypothetical protein